MGPRCSKTETTRTGAEVQCRLGKHPGNVPHEFVLPPRCSARGKHHFHKRCWSHEGHDGPHEFGDTPPAPPHMADDGCAP